MLLSRTRTQSRPKSALSLSLAVSLIFGVFIATPTSAAVSTAVVNTVTPTVGLAGTVVTIDGTGLSLTTAVHFGSVAATSFSNVSSTRVTAVAPAGTGAVDVKVTNASGNVIAKAAFTYKTILTPVITQVSPATGLPTGYNEVNLVGSNFSGATEVKFGTVSAVTFKVNSDTSITAVAPVGTSGAIANIYVTTAAGTSVSAATYTYANVACAPANYLNVKFAQGVSKLTAAQIAQLKTLATQFKNLGCASVNLVRYNETIKKNMTASHKEYIKLQRARAINVYNVVATRLRNLGGTTTIKLVKITNQVSQAKRAYDARTDYRKVSFVVPGVTVIDSVYPSAGSLTGGNTITITGRGLENIALTGAVKFGTTAALYTVNTAKNTLSVVVPPSAVAGTVDLTVQPSATATALAATYTYTSAPTVTTLSQTSGQLAGGNTITITGTNFVGMRSVSGVKFGTANAPSFIVLSPTSISAVVPAGTVAGSVNVTVTNPTGTSTALIYTYVSAPSISEVSPLNLSLNGGTVTIRGTQFAGITSSAIRFSNGSRTWSPTAITSNTGSVLVVTSGAQTSSYAGAIDVTVTGIGGAVTLNDAFVSGTAITGVALTAGGTAEGPIAGGTPITITGVDFPSPVEAVRVGSNNATSVVRVTATSITAVTPSATATGLVSVRVYSDVSANEYVELANAFAYIPTITSISPDEGPLSSGENITITGTGFASTVAVTIGGTTATQVSKTATQIVVTPPTGTAGAKDVVITTNSVSVTEEDGYTYRGIPTVTSMSRTAGILAGGQTVVVIGTNFVPDGGTTLTVDGAPVTPSSVSSSSFTFLTPAHAAGAVSVVITTIGGTVTRTFTYLDAPTITTAPETDVNSGATVTITGTNFVSGGTTATFNGVSVSVSVGSATSLTFTVPTGLVDAAYSFTVTTAGGTDSVSLDYLGG